MCTYLVHLMRDHMHTHLQCLPCHICSTDSAGALLVTMGAAPLATALDTWPLVCIRCAAFKRMLQGVPSAAFEPNKPGLRYGVGARVGCLGVKFLEYSLAGMVCGFIGQGIANQMMHLK